MLINMQMLLSFLGLLLVLSCSTTKNGLSRDIFDIQASYNDYIKNLALKSSDLKSGNIYFSYNEVKSIYSLRNQFFLKPKIQKVLSGSLDTLYILEGINLVDPTLIKGNIWGNDFNLFYTNFRVLKGERTLSYGLDNFEDEIIEASFNEAWAIMKKDLEFWDKNQIQKNSLNSQVFDGFRLIGTILILDQGQVKKVQTITFYEY